MMKIPSRTQSTQRLSRRKFVRRVTLGAASAALISSSAETVLSGVKDSGEVTLDALLITYVSAPLGTTGSSFWTPQLPYTITLGFRAPANPDLRLKVGIAPSQETINSRAQVRQVASEKVPAAVKLFPRPRDNESFRIGTRAPGVPEDTTFYGLYRPVLRFKGNGRKVSFRFVDAESSFAFGADTIRNLFQKETADSIISQYVFDKAALIEPRFVPVQSVDGGPLMLVRKAEPQAPEDITATTTARIIEQNGFASNILKQAFAVGNSLEITYFSAEESEGEIVRFEAELARTVPGINLVFWDRVFKAFVIIDEAS